MIKKEKIVLIYDSKNKKILNLEKRKLFSTSNNDKNNLGLFKEEKSRIVDFINLFRFSYHEKLFDFSDEKKIDSINCFENNHQFIDFIFDVFRIVDFETNKSVYRTLLNNINILIFEDKNGDLNSPTLELNFHDFIHEMYEVFQSNNLFHDHIFDKETFSITNFFDIIFEYKNNQEYMSFIKSFDVNQIYNYNLHLYNLHNKHFLVNCINFFLKQKQKKFDRYFCYFLDEAIGSRKKEEIEFIIKKAFEALDEKEKEEIFLAEKKENLYKTFLYEEGDKNTEKINTVFHLLGGEKVSYEHCMFYYNFGSLKIIKNLADFFQIKLEL